MMLQFEHGEVKKSYRAQIAVAPPDLEGSLSHFIKKDETGRKKLDTDEEGKTGVGFLKRLVEKGKNWLNDDKDLSDF
jgi:23S rRNA-/tRNA-specific pseudouridylate synthase